MELNQLLNEAINETLIKLTISNKRSKQQTHQKGVVRLVKMKQVIQYQLELFTETQVFHENLTVSQLKERLFQLAQADFKQLDIVSQEASYVVKMNDILDVYVKKKATTNVASIPLAHNRQKQYLLAEGTIIPPLIDLGVFTAEGRVVASKYDKYKQINRFIEMIDDAIKKVPMEQLHIVDFGCGKSYLTFILYYYLTELKHIKTTITGLDLKADVIQNCNAIAKKYHYDGLSFQLGDIAEYQSEKQVDMVISLHACDTATDLALYHAIQWNSKMIFSVPCCQHEFNHQFQSKEFGLLGKYGIIKERISALMTDAMRGQLLELCDYEVALLEFIDIEHSPKNILIRAIKKEKPNYNKQILLEELARIEDEFHGKLTLHRLLEETWKKQSDDIATKSIV